MKALFDTNVILDSLLKRSPFEINANTLIHYVERRSVNGYLCSTTITTIYYIAQKDYGKQYAL